MKEQFFILIYVILIILITAAGCTYLIPENDNTKENSTPSPSIEKENRGEDTASNDPALPEGDNSIPDKENKPPVADFSIFPGGEFCVGMNIFFDASSSSDPDGDYLNYYWDFGDGNCLFGPTTYNPVCHRYLIKGEYTVRLQILDGYGGFSVKERLISIREK